MLAVLRRRNFALLWLGQLVSVVGDWILLIALPFYVYQETGSVLATGALFATETVPRLLVSSVAGVFVDRWDRRRTMVAADLLRAVVLLPLLLVPTQGWLWVVYPVGLLEATIAQFFLPARSVMIPRLVPRERLGEANALVSTSDEAANLVGSALGGTLLGVIGLVGLVFVDMASYLVSAVAIAAMRLQPSRGADEPEPGPTPGVPDPVAGVATEPAGLGSGAVWQEWLAGLGLVRRDRLVATVFAVTALAGVAEGLAFVLIIPFVQEVLGQGPAEFGWLMAARAAGALVGGLAVVGVLSRFVPPAWMVVGAGLADGLLLVALFQQRTLSAALVLMVLLGVAVVPFYVGQQTLLQQQVADAFLGRVFGAYEATQALLMLSGMGAAALAGRVGIVPLLTAAGATIAAASLLALALLPAAAPLGDAVAQETD